MVALNVVLAHLFCPVAAISEGETKYEINDTCNRFAVSCEIRFAQVSVKFPLSNHK